MPATSAPPQQPYHQAYQPPQQTYQPPTHQSPAPQLPSSQVKQEFAVTTQNQFRNGNCNFCGGSGHFTRSCIVVGEYIWAGQISRGQDGHLYFADGSRIPRIPGLQFIKECVDRVEAKRTGAATMSTSSTATSANFVRDPPPHMTSSILAIKYPDTDTVLDIAPSAFMTAAQVSTSLNVAEPDFQPYIAQAWASFQAERGLKDSRPTKRVRFDGVVVPTQQVIHSNPQSASVSEELEIVSPEVRQAQQTGQSTSGIPMGAQPSMLKKKAPGTWAENLGTNALGNTSAQASYANPSSPYSPAGQYRYSFPLEDDTAPKRVLDRVLETSVPVPVKELFAVSLEFRKQFHNLTMTKRVTSGSGLVDHVQVNELSGCDPDHVSGEFGDRILHNEDGLIVAHHNLPLRCLDAKVTSKDANLTCVLDSRSEVIAMPKRMWEKLGLPIRSDHTMTMSSANTSTDATLGVLKNLALNFGLGEVCVQVQVLVQANFDLLLGRPFHCLMSATTNDYPDGNQDITIHDPNLGKEYKLPTRPWKEGYPRCRKGIKCSCYSFYPFSLFIRRTHWFPTRFLFNSLCLPFSTFTCHIRGRYLLF
jgi:hypothetical protein